MRKHDRYSAGVLFRRIKDLKPGDRVDLQNDRFADPEQSDKFAYEYETVSGRERETKDCLRVDFESGFSCGFPIGHRVEIDPKQ